MPNDFIAFLLITVSVTLGLILAIMIIMVVHHIRILRVMKRIEQTESRILDQFEFIQDDNMETMTFEDLKTISEDPNYHNRTR